MLEDKCPTCPKYGTGKYCDCGSTGNPVGVGCALLVATDQTFTFSSFKNFKIAEIVERGLKHNYTAVYPDGRIYECKIKKDA